ncbi:ABC transporter permease [Ignavigranum ruoffiae]|uniref:Oligopeptide transport system permease protein n=1 Tax=Ignavigranum ruoffiae TaxID=89093 RepID=A0A1H9CS76_9LACT|nr:ABC transporter permease [Ignavigranum ruoffiae]UPQ84988.1 ABC transporter permease [Ignavigranum ruoffiae]SEQ04025.1 oligopeptide transport system permease protein [Ignavigranum ruoffiae]
MTKFIIKRIGYMLLALFLIVTITFLMMRLAPGNPFAGEQQHMTPAIQQQLNEAYGLDDPWYVQYGNYIKDVSQFNFGESMKYRGRSTNDMIAESFPVSLALGGQSLFIAIGLGVLLGVISAMYHNRTGDYLATIIAVLGISVPSFIVAGLLQYVFGLKLHWLPISGWTSWANRILPSLALGLGYMGNIAKMTRSSLLEQNTSEYVKLARAKGLKKWGVVFKHSLRNALLPVITYLGPLTAGIVTGSFVVENIFAIPGLGRHFVTSINNRDYTVIMGTTVFYAILLLFAVLIVDILYVLVDPRIQLEGADD